MKNTISFIILLIGFLSNAQTIDRVYLKDGRVIEGTITEMNLTIKTADASMLAYVNDEILKIEKIIEVPYAVVENVPVFPDCEDAIEIRKCTSTKISGFVNSSFNTNIFKELGLSGRQRLSVMFKIDIDGSIKSIRVRTAHKKLEEEAIRVVKLLPKMKPGSHNGEKVTVPYTLPIIKMVF